MIDNATETASEVEQTVKEIARDIMRISAKRNSGRSIAFWNRKTAVVLLNALRKKREVRRQRFRAHTFFAL